MPRSLQEILDHGQELAQRFEDYEPTEADRRPVEPLHRARAAVLAKAKAEAELAGSVSEMRSAGYSWATIGSVLGTSGEAARQRYRGADPAALRTPAAAKGAATAVRVATAAVRVAAAARRARPGPRG